MLKCKQILRLQDIDKLAFKIASGRKPLALTNFFNSFFVGFKNVSFKNSTINLYKGLGDLCVKIFRKYYTSLIAIMERQFYFLLALGLCCYTDIGESIIRKS